ncbi:MAG TPA: hypothetical protein VN673_14610 [Clostridia bacterium]|nr:hypothetical protein [Clostridia bacterium]
MKARPSMTIHLHRSGDKQPIRLRIVAKPSNYMARRFWVVLPPSEPKAVERWQMVPSLEKAIALWARWLTAEAHQHFCESVDNANVQAQPPKKQK